MKRDELIQEAVRAALTAVDFCGNVMQAIRQVADDNETTFTADEVASIRAQVYGGWNRSRSAAGVKPRRYSGYSEGLIFGR